MQVKLNEKVKRGKIADDEASENLENDDDLLNMDQNNGLGAPDQEQLTVEEKEEAIVKTLNSNNP